MMAGQAEERGGREGAAARTSGGKEAASILGQERPEQPRSPTARPTPSAYTALQKKAAELVGAAEEHRPVPRPRHPAGLRLDRDDPGAAAVHQEPEGHRRAARRASRTRRSRSSPTDRRTRGRTSCHDLPLIQADRAVPPPAATTSDGWSSAAGYGSLSRTGPRGRHADGARPAAARRRAGLAAGGGRPCCSPFTNWDGIGGLGEIEWVGLEELRRRRARSTRRSCPRSRTTCSGWPSLFLVATPFGMFLAVLLDKELRGSRFYQTALYLPVVLSLALVGFVWQLIYSRDQGLLNARARHRDVDWYGDPNVNIWAVLVAAGWRHVGYIMLLYLAGLKGVDPSLREAAAVDGATRGQTFFRVVFPVMRPINIIVAGHHGDRVAARVRPRLGDQQGPQRPGADLRAGHPERRRARPAGSASARRWRRSCWSSRWSSSPSTWSTVMREDRR